MTLRTKESDPTEDQKIFSDKLFSQMENHSPRFDLSGGAPLFTLLHPALIKTSVLYELGREIQQPSACIQGWHYKSYEDEKSARSFHPEIQSFKGFPWIIHQHLIQDTQDTLIDFGTLGWAFLTRQALENPSPLLTLLDYQLPQWLDYALSAELWGSAGKWTRFHDRLHTLFEKYGLLIGQDFPGFYPLKTEARKLESAGFFGHKSDVAYLLIFPWDFSLSALNELENVLLRELSCSS
jgi:hypothetical protein